MLTVTYRKHGIKLSHVWFASEEEIFSGAYKEGSGNLIFLHGTMTAPHGGKLYSTQHTLIKDLTPSEDELFASLGKHLRQYIKRSKNDAHIANSFYDPGMIRESPVVIDICGRLYDKMFADKGSLQHFNVDLANRYALANALYIGISFFGEKPVGFSAIVADENNARLWTSAFDFRNGEMDAQVLSRAHQRLDWEILLWCKRLGIRRFDFGCVNSFDNPNGIAQFKMKFEQNNRTTYDNYLIPNSVIGKIALAFYLRSRS